MDILYGFNFRLWRSIWCVVACDKLTCGARQRTLTRWLALITAMTSSFFSSVTIHGLLLPFLCVIMGLVWNWNTIQFVESGSVVITKFLFKQSTSLFEWFIVREINLDQVATLFRGKKHFKHGVWFLSQTWMKYLRRQRQFGITWALCRLATAIFKHSYCLFCFLPSNFSLH